MRILLGLVTAVLATDVESVWKSTAELVGF